MTFPAGEANPAYLLPYAASALVSAALAAAISLGSRRNPPPVRDLARLLWLESIWAVLLLCEILSPGIRGKVLWDNLQFPVSIGAAVSLFLFARGITASPDSAPRRADLAWYLPALVSGILAFTDPLHRLLRSSLYIDRSVPFGELVYGYTAVDYTFFVYTYGVALAAMVMLVRSYLAAPGKDRRKYRLVILGLLLPMAGTLPSLLGIRIFGRRDQSPIWFAIGTLPIFIAIFRYRLFDIMPLARRVLVDSLGDPIVVFDADGLLDCNRAFSELVGVPSRRLRGRRLAQLLSAWPEAGRAAIESVFSPGNRAGESESVAVSDPAGKRSYKVDVSSIPGELGSPGEPSSPGESSTGAELCKVALFRDITELAAVERQLQAWNAELESRIASRIRELEREVSRRKAAEEGLRRVSARLVGSQHEILVTLSEVVENRSPETANHVLRVGEYSRILAASSGLSPEGVALIVDAAPLHDVGKIAVPDSILNKPGPLTEGEMSVMRTHTTVGYRILGSSERSIIRAAAVIALEHHERWNGSGYPGGKAGAAISLSGRIVCVCDVFDALATSRPYKRPWQAAAILEYFKSESGMMFDPRLVEILLANFEGFLDIASRYPDPQPPGLA